MQQVYIPVLANYRAPYISSKYIPLPP